MNFKIEKRCNAFTFEPEMTVLNRDTGAVEFNLKLELYLDIMHGKATALRMLGLDVSSEDTLTHDQTISELIQIYTNQFPEKEEIVRESFRLISNEIINARSTRSH